MTYQAFAVQEHHREALERLWAESMSDRRIAAVRAKRWTWLYDGNPAGPALTYVVQHVESGQIVGSASAYPRDMVVLGKPCKAGVLADFVTHKAHRVAGPAVMVQRAIADAHRQRGLDFVFGYPNKGAAPIFPRLRFKTVGESTLWVKPLRTAKKLATFLHPITAHMLAPFANTVLAANDLRLAASRFNHHHTTFDRLPDQAFDDLWERCKDHVPVGNVRTSAYLFWRYVHHTTERYRIFTLQDRDGGRVHGYVVFTVKQDRVFVADLLADGGYPGIEALLLAFCRHMRRKGHESVCVNYAGNDRFLASLRALQFVKRLGTRKLIAFVAKDQPDSFRNAIYDNASWFMHDGELDI
jgi:hypothetical protein